MVVERIRQQLEERRFHFADLPLTATASFGIAGFSGTNPPEFGELIARADAALYRAKEKGRNQIDFAI